MGRTPRDALMVKVSSFCYIVASKAFRLEPSRDSRQYAGLGVQLCPYRRRTRCVPTTRKHVCRTGSPRALETVVPPKRLPARPCIGHPVSGSASSTGYGRGEAPDETSSAEPSQIDVGNGQTHPVQALRQATPYCPWGSHSERLLCHHAVKLLPEAADPTAIASPGPW